MLNLVYISDEDRERLVQLNEAVRSCTTVEEVQKVRQEILELEAKKKPLHECTLEECSELRTFVWGKFDKLNRAGKYHLAQQFKMALMQIETRQRLIHREMAIQEAQRKSQPKPPKEKKDIRKERDAASTSKTRPQQSSSRWTTGVGNLD